MFKESLSNFFAPLMLVYCQYRLDTTLDKQTDSSNDGRCKAGPNLRLYGFVLQIFKYHVARLWPEPGVLGRLFLAMRQDLRPCGKFSTSPQHEAEYCK
jgi:hypothetical protein